MLAVAGEMESSEFHRQNALICEAWGAKAVPLVEKRACPVELMVSRVVESVPNLSPEATIVRRMNELSAKSTNCCTRLVPLVALVTALIVQIGVAALARRRRPVRQAAGDPAAPDR